MVKINNTMIVTLDKLAHGWQLNCRYHKIQLMYAYCVTCFILLANITCRFSSCPCVFPTFWIIHTCFIIPRGSNSDPLPNCSISVLHPQNKYLCTGLSPQVPLMQVLSPPTVQRVCCNWSFLAEWLLRVMAGYESWKKPLRPYNFSSIICSETESMLSHAKSCLAHRTGASGKRSFSQNYPANMPFWCLCGATAGRKLGYIMPTVNPQFAQ